MPGRIDVAFALLLIAVSIVEHFYFWPRFRADAAADRPHARPRAYRRAIVGEWVLALAAIAIWAANDRAWSALSLSIPGGWRLALGGVLVLAILALMWVQLASVARLPAVRRVAARPTLGALAFMLPRTHEERFWFLTLSATAGFCEELLYRGYLPWLFAPWLGPIGSMALAVLVFGISHAYQGRTGAVKATIVGALLGTVVLATHSLVPAMLLHALIDAQGGTVGYLLLRDDHSPTQSAPVPIPAH
jgi:CAAX protease family protein